MSHYRKAPEPLPSMRDVEAEEATAPRATHGPHSFESYCAASAREPFILGELREERRARERAAAAPCPAFATGKPLGGWHPAMPPPASDRAALRTFAMALSRDD